MPVKTKSYNDPIDDKEDGERYLIMRHRARPSQRSNCILLIGLETCTKRLASVSYVNDCIFWSHRFSSYLKR